MKKIYQKFIAWLKNDKHEFAKGLCGEKIFIIFVIGSLFGCYYEMFLNLIVHYYRDGSIFWETRRGVIYGPFSPIYGAGAALMTYLLLRKKRPWYEIYGYGALIGGGFEYLISFLQETFVGTVSWNYSDYFLNINGRTTIPFMLVWGLGAIILSYIVYPLISKMVAKIPFNLAKLIYRILLIFLIIDMAISWTALLRQTVRRAGYGPYTIVDKLYDHYYNDERLRKAFPNMVIK